MLLDYIKNAYDTFEQFHISITVLIAVGMVLFIAFLFAVREAAAWFFKIDDIKRDVRKLHLLTAELETELRAIQDFVLKGAAKDQQSEQSRVAEPVATIAASTMSSQPKTAKTASFPITH